MLLDIAQAGETAGAIAGETSVTRSKLTVRLCLRARRVSVPQESSILIGTEAHLFRKKGFL